MEVESEFERTYSVLSWLLFIVAVSADFWVWLIGAFFVFVIGGLALSDLSEQAAYILPMTIGFIFLFGVLLPIVMVVIYWQKNRLHPGAGDSMREP